MFHLGPSIKTSSIFLFFFLGGGANVLHFCSVERFNHNGCSTYGVDIWWLLFSGSTWCCFCATDELASEKGLCFFLVDPLLLTS